MVGVGNSQKQTSKKKPAWRPSGFKKVSYKHIFIALGRGTGADEDDDCLKFDS